jgi:hypothetical protein
LNTVPLEFDAAVAVVEIEFNGFNNFIRHLYLSAEEVQDLGAIRTFFFRAIDDLGCWLESLYQLRGKARENDLRKHILLTADDLNGRNRYWVPAYEVQRSQSVA